MFIYIIFLFLSVLSTFIIFNFEGYTSIKGVSYELYKLTRNIPIFFFSYWTQNEEKFSTNLKLYFFSTFILVLTAIFEYFGGLKAYEIMKFTPNRIEYNDFYNIYLRDNRTMGLMKHPSIFASFVSITLLIVIYATAMRVKILKHNLIQNLVLILSLIGVFISGSRSIFILVIIIPIFLSIVFNVKRIKKIYFGLMIITAPFLIFAINQLFFKLWQYSYYTFELGQTEVRLVYWKQCLEILKNNVLFGTGLGTWGDASAKFSTFFVNYQIIDMSDSYLSHILTENGIFTILIFIIGLSTLLYFIKMYKNSINDNVKLLNIIGISLLLLIFFESFKSMQMSMFENTFFIFYLFGYIFKYNEVEKGE
jgi:O-antigen ligase